VSALRNSWELRNAAAETLIKVELQVREQLESSSIEQIAALLDSFSPARSPGPEWTRSFEALIERIWAWCDASTVSALEAEFRSRGAAWAPVANALDAEHGAKVQSQLRAGLATARLPLFTLG
jgi:hypothetical protein